MKKALAFALLLIAASSPTVAQVGLPWPGPGGVAIAPFAPTDISDLTLWLKGDAGVYKDAGTTLAVNNDTVQQWNDQSGNANHCTQATAGNRPTYKTAIINSQAVVRGDGTDDVLTCPNIYPTGTASGTLFVVNKQANSTGIQALVGDAGGGVNDHALYFNSTDVVYYQGASNQLTTPAATAGTAALYQLNIVGRTNTNAATTQAINLFINQSLKSQIVNTEVNTVNTMTLFEHAGVFPSSGDIAEVLLYSRTLKVTEVNSIVGYLNTKYSLGLSTWATDKQVICDGDSITQGFRSGTSNPFCALLQAHESRFGLNLGSQAAEASDLTSQGASVVDSLYSSSITKNIVVWFAGTNDIVLNAKTGAQAYSSFQTYCSDRHSAGWLVVAVPMLPRGSAGDEINRGSLNTSLASDGCADAKVPVACDSNMWGAGANTNATYFDADTVHPNATGHAAIYACIATAVDSL